MIIEFSVSNFRSIRDEARLSFVATTDKELAASNLIETGLLAAPRVTRSAVIYGANASGKSNLILALLDLKSLVTSSFTGMKPGQPFGFQPFKLELANVIKPTELEVTFVLNGVRHQYGCAFNAERIIEEWLHVYVNPKPQTWFYRKFDVDANEDKYVYSNHLKGDKEVWQKATRPNALFLSTAAQHNSEQLLPIYRWFSEKLVVLPMGNSFTPDQTVNCLRNESLRNKVIGLITAADVGINDVSLVKRLGVQQSFKLNKDGTIESTREDREVMMPLFTHRSGDRAVAFELEQESQGTQRFFNLIGPIIDNLQNGKTLIVDELDSSLHPLLVRRIIEMFHNPELNTQGAQLLFTTHDTSLLDVTNLLRRDQIWLTEKSTNHATVLAPLTEFSPRKGEALERGYLMGRYGAVPMLDSFSNALKKSAEHL
jgi:AAA15 family ATPase/GTPase